MKTLNLRPTLGALTLWYLALPNIVFLAGWIVPWLGWPAAVILAVAIAWLARGDSARIGASRILWIGCAVAVPWVLLSGVGHFVYANSDWVVRDAVLSDLVNLHWPVTYGAGADAVLLRAPLGYFLVAAVLGKLGGVGVADGALALWTLLGVLLTFSLLLRGVTSGRSALIRLGVFVLFSGMDIVGTLLHGTFPAIGAHIEWWAQLFQYSSNTTQLFWVPNHALPAWIAMAWILGYREPVPVGRAVAIVALTPLWSPFAAVGLVPLFAARLLADAAHRGGLKRLLREVASPAMLAVVIVTCAFVDPYLLIAGDTIPSHWTFAGMPVAAALKAYSCFVVVEFLPLALLLIARGPRDALIVAATCVLLVLPLYTLGLASDLTMRASIPSLLVLAYRLGEWLSIQWGAPPGVDGEPAGEDWRSSVVMLLFGIGAITPLLEISRPFVAPRWDRDAHRTVAEVTEGATHYVAHRRGAWARYVLAD